MPLSFSARTAKIAFVLVASAAVACVFAFLNTRQPMQQGTATAQVMIDFPGPSIVNRRALPQDLNTLQQRATLYGELLTTPRVLERVARRAGIPADQLSGIARPTMSIPISLKQPNSELRASQIVASRARYRLELQADPAQPILGIYAAAPSAEEAEKVARAAVSGLEDSMRELATQQRFSVDDLARFRVLAPIHGIAVGGRVKPATAVLTFLVVFALLAAVPVALLARQSRQTWGAEGLPAPHERVSVAALRDWPRTTRVLPWAIAAFLAMLWLTPFDRIELAMNAPIDLKLDRLLLPLVFGVWLVSFAAGKVAAPRLRLTGIHLAVAAFVGVAFLSVVLNAHELNQTMELELSLKKLPLLVSYVAVFLIVSSSIRPSEVPAFLKLTLGLGLIVGLGIIWEYRSHVNVFALIAENASVGPIRFDGGGEASYVDSIGRRGIVGPTAVGLEAVTVLTLALPIVLAGLISTPTRRQRLLYAIAACVVIAATLATGRKSALLAPLSVVLVMSYFRRRELLALAPVGLVIGAAVAMLSSGAIHSVLDQVLRSDRASIATTSDRTADYDAVRPDVWTHLLFGRGYGSYDHNTYRILDSEILGRLIETGVIGLLAFLMIGVSVVLCARPVIARREPRYASAALVGAAAAVCFLTSATLYDITAFPHATYIFLTIAGLAAVVVSRDGGRPARRAVGEPADGEVESAPRRSQRASERPHDALV